MVNKKKKLNRKRFASYYLPVVALLLLTGFVFLNYSFKKKKFEEKTVNIAILPKEEADMEEYIIKAKENLSKRMGIDFTEIKTIKAEKRNFSDTSLGCPQKNRFYAQVITEGYIIILKAQNREFDYRAGSKEVRICNLN